MSRCNDITNIDMDGILLFNLWGDKLDELQAQAKGRTSFTLEERAYLYRSDNIRKLKDEFIIRVQEILNVALLNKDYNPLVSNFTERCISLFNDFMERLRRENLAVEDVIGEIDSWNTMLHECLFEVASKASGNLDPSCESKSDVAERICSEVGGAVGRHIKRTTEKLRGCASQVPKEKSSPRKSFEEYIIHPDKSKVIEVLGRLLQGKRNKEAVVIIIAAINGGYIIKPTYASVQQQFGDIGTKSNYNRIIGVPENYADVVAPIKAALEKEI